MEILISIVAKIAEYTVAPIGRQMGYLIFYKDNFQELQGQIEELKNIKDFIKHHVEIERRNGREIEGVVQDWLGKVDEIIEEVKKLGEDPRHRKVGCSKSSFPNLRSRHQLSRNAKKMVKIVAEVQRKGNFDRVGYLPPLDGVGSTSTTIGTEKLESRKSMKKDIVLALKDPKISKIGVYGLSGVGKTTLVYQIAKQVKDENLFNEVVIITRSQTPDLKIIQSEIAELLGLCFEETSINGRARRLCRRIKDETHILIILDDIKEKINLEKLGIPSNDSHKGCKLLLTSKNEDILHDMESEKDFRLDVLNAQETWSLFQFVAGDVIKDVNLQDIAMQVAKKCGGLPVLIVTLAKSLKNKQIYYWKDALNKLERADNKEMHDIVYSALELSYNQLEDDETKAVFLLCGVQTSSWASDLLKYVIGLGVFKHINTIEDARNRLCKIIDDLKASCLLLEDEESKMVKMHDVIHEVAISIASRDQYVFTTRRNVKLKDWPNKDFLERCTQIILNRCCIQKLPKRLDCPNLKFLLVDSTNNRTLEIPHSFFKGMGNLEVLDLTGMIISSLPTSLTCLTKLKTFCLDQCSLKDMARIGALKSLEILSFIDSSMEEFPCEIGQLTHLRMLDLSASGIEVIPPNIVSKLTKLEELYMGNTLIKWEVESSTKQNKNASLAELRHLTKLTTLEIQIHEVRTLPTDIMFEKLERHKIVIGDKWEWPRENGVSRLLKLKLDTSIHLEHGIKTLMKRVEDLYLDEINGVSNVLYQLNGEGFPLLRHLHIQNNAEIQHIINSIGRHQAHVFPNLETLVLYNLNNLEKICHGPFMINSFGKLKAIKVKSCDQLKYHFSILMVKALSQLLEIEVSKCNSMKKIVFVESVDSGITIDEKIEFHSLRSLTLQHLPIVDDFYSNELTSSITAKQNSWKTNIPTSFFNANVKFFNLETLKLSSINLEKIWDDDQFSIAFRSLANLTVEDCSGLKYLFSSSMIGSLLNLKRLEISKCDLMEEIIATKERNGAALEEVRFSNLETIIINNMKSLKKVWHFQFDGLKTLEVNNCEKLGNIFPSYKPRTFGSLETLKVSDCGSMEEIFTVTANEIQSEDYTMTQLKKLHLLNLPKLKQIWSNDPEGILRFHNLQDMHVEDCGNMEYLFPFSIALDLLQLEKLYMDACGMKEIVAKKEGPIEGKRVFDFRRLYSLVIWNMHKLDRFYAGNHSLACPSLRVLRVFNCAKLKLFERHCRNNQRKISDSKTHVSMQQPLFQVEEVIPSLEELNLSNKDTIMILQDQQWRDHFRKLKHLRLYDFEDKQATTFLDTILLKAPNLETLVVQDSSLKEIFQDERLARKEGKNEICTQLKNLTLCRLQELQHICREGCQTDSTLEVLEVLYVTECASLKILVPSSVIFSHLTYLEIENCHGLINLMYSSTARNLVKLESMKLKECNSLEEIVTQEVNETKDEIVFSSLEILKLECLPRLNSFSCSKCFSKFPLLKKVVVRQCPKMKIFSARETSTPMLRKVLKEEEDEEWCWEGDLNGTIRKMFLDKVAFRNSEHLDLSMYPELKGLWYSQVENRIFCNLKSLMVQKCDFLSNVLISSNLLRALCNLEELEVRDCHSLKVVFEFYSTNEGEILEKEAIHLRKISLFNLPKLKHIWKQDCQEIVSLGDSEDVHAGICDGLKMSKAPGFGEKREEDEVEIQRRQPGFLVAEPEQIWSKDPQTILPFDNLQVVRVEDCKDLEYLFPFSIAMDLLQLEEITIKQAGKMKEIVSKKEGSLEELKFEELNIESCGVEEIIAIEKRSEELKFDFPRLTIFRLRDLTQLNSFYPGRHTLECPSLKILDVGGCEALQIFAFGHLDSQQLKVDDVDMPIHQALFHVEKVSHNLEELSLNEKDAMRILNGHYEKNHFHSIEVLRLQYFQETPIMFLNDLLEKFPRTTILQVRYSFFETLFPLEEIGFCSVKSPTQIKALWLFKLEQLEHIWNDDCVLESLVQNLQDLFIGDCSRLMRLAPPSISFINLTTLEVVHCNGLIYLITSFTAKSLVHLTSLTVKNCGMMENVVMTDEGELNEEITFEILEYLELTSLSSFNSFCSGKHTFIFPSLVRLTVTGCHKMQNFSSGVTIAPFLTIVEVENGKKRWKEDVNTTIEQLFMDKASQEGDEVNYKESSSNISGSSQMHQGTASTSEASSSEEHVRQSKPDQIVDAEKQEIHKLPSLSDDKEQKEHALLAYPPSIQGAQERPSVRAAPKALSPLTIQDTAIEAQKMCQVIERPLVLAIQNTMSLPTVHDAAIRTQKMYETIEKPLVQATKNALSPNDEATGTQETYETIDKPLVQIAQNAPSPAIVQDTGTQEMSETVKRPLVQAAQNTLSLTTIQDIGTQEIYKTVKKSLVQVAQNARSSAIVQNAEKSHDPETLLGENLPNEATNLVIAENRTTIDPAPSQAPKAMTSSLLALDAYSSYKGMIDVPVHNLPYLEAGVKRHPQVLDWLNTKRHRVFASSFFSLFAEVTRLLRTTRRGDLTEDDRNYIRVCCASLQVAGFDASWLSYVYGCIEQCDDRENLKRRINEAEGQAATLKAQLDSIKKELASVETSLVWLRDKASRLDDFIES